MNDVGGFRGFAGYPVARRNVVMTSLITGCTLAWFKQYGVA